jgi:hypothetical protein
VLRNDRHDPNSHAICVRHVRRDEINAGITKVEQERRIMRGPIDLGDQQRGSVPTTSCKGSGQFPPVVTLATFNLGELGNQLPPPAIEEVVDALSLGVEA